MSYFALFSERPPLLEEQELLLSALLRPGPEAHDMLVRWVTTVDFDQLDPGSFRLIPALFKRWSADPAIERYRGRMKGIYRYFMFRSNLVSEAARPALEAMSDAGIETVAIKGLAIGLKYHRNLALRPMSDVDVLIHRRDLNVSEKAIAATGWNYRYDPASKALYLHSYDYTDGNGHGLDLHWFALRESIVAGVDDALWSRTETFDWQGMPIRVPVREDLVLLALVNAIRDIDAMQCNWVHDVATLIQHAPDFNWHLLWEEASRRGVLTQVFSALQVLAHVTPWLVDDSNLHDAMRSTPSFIGDRILSVLSESGWNGLTAAGASHARRMPRTWIRRPPWRATSDDVLLPRGPRHVGVRRDPFGNVIGLRLQQNNVGVLNQIFSIEDRSALEEALAHQVEDAEITIPSGLLQVRSTSTSAYSAEVKLIDSPYIALPPGGVGQVRLKIRNVSPEAWIVHDGNTNPYGASYHVHEEDDRPYIWDQSRAYFINWRQRSLTFLEPGGQLLCHMTVNAPSSRGRYILHLDIVHETIAWFSAHGGRFPVVSLRVE